MENLDRGAKAIAQSLDGEVELRVWEVTSDTVYLCSERQYTALSEGRTAPMPIGFPKSDVRQK